MGEAFSFPEITETSSVHWDEMNLAMPLSSVWYLATAIKVLSFPFFFFFFLWYFYEETSSIIYCPSITALLQVNSYSIIFSKRFSWLFCHCCRSEANNDYFKQSCTLFNFSKNWTLLLNDCWLHAIYRFEYLCSWSYIWAAARQNQQNELCVQPPQIRLGIRPIWSESSLSTWRNLGSLASHWAYSEDFDQTGRMPRLIWFFAGHTCHFVGFVMLWLISFSGYQATATSNVVVVQQPGTTIITGGCMACGVSKFHTELS